LCDSKIEIGRWDELRTKFVKNGDKIEEVLGRVERLIKTYN
jgi:hypothetical protein